MEILFSILRKIVCWTFAALLIGELTRLRPQTDVQKAVSTHLRCCWRLPWGRQGVDLCIGRILVGVVDLQRLWGGTGDTGAFIFSSGCLDNRFLGQNVVLSCMNGRRWMPVSNKSFQWKSEPATPHEGGTMCWGHVVSTSSAVWRQNHRRGLETPPEPLGVLVTQWRWKRRGDGDLAISRFQAN